MIFKVYLFFCHNERWQRRFDEIIKELLGDVEISLGNIGYSLGHLKEVNSQVGMQLFFLNAQN